MNLFCFSKDEWLAYLSIVTEKLDVRESMELDEDLVNFVDKRRKTEIHVEKVNVCEIFECIFPKIQGIVMMNFKWTRFIRVLILKMECFLSIIFSLPVSSIFIKNGLSVKWQKKLFSKNYLY